MFNLSGVHGEFPTKGDDGAPRGEVNNEPRALACDVATFSTCASQRYTKQTSALQLNK